MAEIKHPKRYYYAMRNKYMRELKQIGHKLSLATSEAEDEMYWEKYRKVLKRWRDLEIPEGVKHRSEMALQTQKFRKPEITEEYVALTNQLKVLYSQIKQAKGKEEFDSFEKQIQELKKRRVAITHYTDREV